MVEGLPARSPDVCEEKKGPRVGAPEAAVQGFLKSAGLAKLEQAEVRPDKKGDYYMALLERPGRPTPEVVGEIVPEIIRNFPWPKSMRWGSGRLRWVRPLHAILCVFAGKVVPIAIDGIASGKETRGHRFMAPKPFSVKNFQDYEAKLRKGFVVLDGNERAVMILDAARALAGKERLELIEDEALLEENAGLTEWPVVLIGRFDESFLEVPPEVLATAMKAHQKCFSLARGKELANRFIMVANLEAEDGGKAIVAGNERVIRARLADAKYFFDHDRKVMLEERVLKLKEIIFHDKLGTQYGRIQRMRLLAREIALMVGADPDLAERAAILAKADLVSDMVGEFPGAARRHGPLLRPRPGRGPGGRRRHRRPLQAGRPVRSGAARSRGHRRRARRQIRHAGWLLGHRREADRLQGSVCAPPRRARRHPRDHRQYAASAAARRAAQRARRLRRRRHSHQGRRDHRQRSACPSSPTGSRCISATRAPGTI